MNIRDIVENVNSFLIDDFEIDPNIISPNAKIIDDLDIDSLDFVDIVVFIEEEFDIKLEINDFKNVFTLQDFYDLIEKKIK